MPIREISENQARQIALRALGYDENESARVQAVYEGGTQDGRFPEGQIEIEHGSSECCWLIALCPLEKRGYAPDGPEYVVWVDARTGNMLKVLRLPASEDEDGD